MLENPTPTSSSQPGRDEGASLPRQRRTPPLHPVLFAIYPVMALLARNLSQTSIAQSLRTFALFAGAGILLWAVVLLFYRNLRKSALVTSTAILLLSSYGHILNLTPDGVHGIVMPVCILVFLAVAIACARTRQPLLDTTAALNVMAGALTIMSGYTILAQSHSQHAVAAAAPKPHRALGTAEANAPDIYYIVLDAYGRADRLKQFYSFDNSAFIAELQKRGFYVAQQSGANYDQTPLCLSSCLSMGYLDRSKMDTSPEGLRKLVDDSAVAKVLQDHGRHYINVWSGLDVSRVETAETVYNNSPDLNAFEKQAIQMSALVRSKKLQHDLYQAHRQRINGVFDGLAMAAALPEPKFVFAHALCPHPPFVFGANGEEVDPRYPYSLADGSWLLASISREEYVSGYTGQLQYVNRKILQAIDTILAHSRVTPIIILQGDHGSRMNVDWSSEKRTDLREPFSILNAYLVPPSIRQKLYPTITPVNSFRVVLSSLFKEKLPLLKDSSYYSTAEQMDRFSDVTGLIPHVDGPQERPAQGSAGAAAMESAAHGIH
jgi:hypothetical protein